MSSFYIVDINPLPDTQFANIFFYYIGCLFILLIVSFAVQKLFIDSLMLPPLVYFCSCYLSFWFPMQKKIAAKTNVSRLVLIV